MSSNLVRRTTIVTSLERAFCKMANGTGSKVRTGTAQNVCVCDFGDLPPYCAFPANSVKYRNVTSKWPLRRMMWTTCWVNHFFQSLAVKLT